jgi:hypothetical protein
MFGPAFDTSVIMDGERYVADEKLSYIDRDEMDRIFNEEEFLCRFVQLLMRVLANQISWYPECARRTILGEMSFLGDKTRKNMSGGLLKHYLLGVDRLKLMHVYPV